jgi:septum formation protein
MTDLEPISTTRPILLGSASPRRRDILRELGLPHLVRVTETPELQQAGDTPESFLERVVLEKLRAAHGAKLPDDEVSCVLVADTVVVLGEQILGKPKDAHDAARLVGMLVGRTHRVLTRFAISWVAAGQTRKHATTVESRVTMRRASPDEVLRYAATGEGLDKAGAYAVQGLGAFLVERVDGSYTNVVGLPACELVQALTDTGLLRDFPRVF